MVPKDAAAGLNTIGTDSAELHQRSIVVDCACAILAQEKYIGITRSAGLTAGAASVAGESDNVLSAMKKISSWLETLQRRSAEVMHIQRAEDFRLAKESGKLGIIFHFQGTAPLESSLEMVSVYQALGVRVVQLTYNARNYAGDGCDERVDGGLSDFGVKLVKALNRVGIAVDCSHASVQTSLDAIEVSEAPVLMTHSNAKTLCNSPRNLTDEQIRRVAASGGVIGVNGFPAFVSSKRRPSLDDLLRHVDYMVDLVGINHVGIGLDFFLGQAGVIPPRQAKARYEALVASGRWKPDSYPPPPYYYPTGIDGPHGYPNLTRGLLERGFSEEDVTKILGQNLIRVFRQVWQGNRVQEQVLTKAQVTSA